MRNTKLSAVFKFFLIGLQCAVIFFAAAYLSDIFRPIDTAFKIFSILLSLFILNIYMPPEYKASWIAAILILPVYGSLLYLLFGNKAVGKFAIKKIRKNAYQISAVRLKQDKSIFEELKNVDISAARQAQYIVSATAMPLRKNTVSEFLCPGEKYYAALIKALKNAESFIYLEYFTIAEGKMWDSILDILKNKAKAGLDVRIIYDGMGCLKTLPKNYNKYLETLNIKCCVFNPFLPLLCAGPNSRDHKKICIIDGNISFIGGINIADEYINEKKRFGHWLDSGIMLNGSATANLLADFLSVWDFLKKEKTPCPDIKICKADSAGFYIPFADNPYIGYGVFANVIKNMLSGAKKYIYISTPYLVISHSFTEALMTAAKSGTDIRLYLPGVPDKKAVYILTKSNFSLLTRAGVKIYLYKKGFVHSKTIVCDDTLSLVGSANLDYRSLYLHFENGVWMYDKKTALSIKDTFFKAGKRFQPCYRKKYEKLSMV